MRLENLYPNFGEMSPEAQLQYVRNYRNRRAEDMAKEPTWPKPKKKAAGGKRKSTRITLTPEEESVKKLLGLTKKQVINMRKLKEN